MDMRWLLLFIYLTFPLPAMGQENAAPAAEAPPVITGDFKDLKHTSSGRIDKVIDGSTILLKDGKIIQLLAVYYPFSVRGEANDSAILAKARLEKLLPEATEVMLYQTRNQKAGRISRMGHTLAHLVIKESGEWINGVLLAEGYAYAMTDQSNPEMAAQLYKLEDKARAGRLGLWKDGSPDGILTPDTASQGSGQFRVVEGRVNRSATAQNNLYLNFGTDWKKDFTVQITPAIRKTLAKRGIDPMGLSGQTVRARGWIREWNGPFLELETPERLELLKPAPQPAQQTD